MPFCEGYGGQGAMQMLDVAGVVMLGQGALAKFAELVTGHTESTIQVVIEGVSISICPKTDHQIVLLELAHRV